MIEFDGDGFDAVINDYIEKAKTNTRDFAIEFIQDLNEAVVANPSHPLKTGFLRGSWYASFSPDDPSVGTLDQTGGATIARMNLVAASLEIGAIYYARNGASYAGFLEYGTSKMAPRAFVRGPLSSWREIAERTATRIAAR